MIPAPLFTNLFSQIASNLASVAMEDKVDNPYLKAVLGPLLNTFIGGIMSGASSDVMAQQAVGQAIPNSYDPTNGQALAGLTPDARQLAQDLTPVIDQAKVRLSNVQ